ncbi:ABC transporter ATP-binding protein [Prolixibacteraceae bacterium JC049]|nr:ABC transporter ATP-binding protein [Prolixibacteraceae bacterium JC049]
MEILSAHHVEKMYANHRALTDVSISIEEGSVFGLLGPNGAGKTTLLRIINQITAPDKGTVNFKGRPLRLSDVELIGYLPEERGLYKKMKVGEQALYLAQLKGLSRRDALRRLKTWFEKFEIQPWWDKKVMELSKGMQQKVQFICTVLHEPELLIFDEPFSGFDPINANILKEEILALKERGATLIFSTHNMASVEEVCDHIALINESKKILDGSIDKVRDQFKSNTFEVSFKGAIGDVSNALVGDFEILDHTEGKRFDSIRVKHLNGTSNNELLTRLTPNVEIVSFSEVIPSMNDIFIRAVEETRQK